MNTVNWYQKLSGKYTEDGVKIKDEPVFRHVGKKARRKIVKQVDPVDRDFNSLERYMNKQKELI